MLPFETEAIVQIVQNVWASVLGLEIVPTGVDDPHQSHSGQRSGLIQISGTWPGVVCLHCDEALARHAASVMFSLSLDELNEMFIDDALGELTNMTGGNLKALVPEPCVLSIPAVGAAADPLLPTLPTEPTCKLHFLCEGQPVTVALYAECQLVGLQPAAELCTV